MLACPPENKNGVGEVIDKFLDLARVREARFHLKNMPRPVLPSENIRFCREGTSVKRSLKKVSIAASAIRSCVVSTVVFPSLFKTRVPPGWSLAPEIRLPVPAPCENVRLRSEVSENRVARTTPSTSIVRRRANQIW